MRKKNGEKSDGENKRRRRTVQYANWENAEASILREVICAVTGTGGAIRFGYTQDGGSYSIGLLGEHEPDTEYLSGGEDINVYLTSLRDDYLEPE